MPDVNAALAASNVVAIAAPAAGTASGQNGAGVGLADASASFDQHISDSQATAQGAVNGGQAVGKGQGAAGAQAAATGAAATASTDENETTDGTGVSQTPPQMNVVQVPVLTPAPAVASIKLSGSAQDLAALSARVQQLQQLLQQQQPPLNLDTLTGSDGDTAQLSAALQKLGLSPADAAAQAGKITTALKAFKAKLSDAGVDTDKLSGAGLGTTVGGSTLGQIAAMMMAGNPQLKVLDTTATLSGEVGLQINVSEASNSTADGVAGTAQARVAAFAQQAMAMGREMMGLGSAQATAQGKEATAIAVDEQTPINVALGQQPAESAPATAAATATTEVMAQQATEMLQGLSGNQATGSGKVSGSAAAAGVSKVASKAVLAPLKGEVLYKWQASAQMDGTTDSKDGDAGTVTATPAAHKQMSDLVNAPAVKADATVAAGTGGAMAVAGADTPLAQFADKLAVAMRSNVTEQATVQLRGLSQGLQDGTVGGAAGTSGNADAGATGGQVRMLLNPPELGEIRIDLTVKDGSVHGTIAASDTAVVSLLAREVHTLKHGLDQAGLKLGEQGINLMLSNSNQQGNSQQQGGQQPSGQAAQGLGRNLGTELASDDADGTVNALGAVSNPANWVSPDRVVDVRV